MTTDKTVSEKNEVIARWMGYNHPVGYESWERPCFTEDYVKDAKYHTSWDWLMPVVEKMKDYGLSDNASDEAVQKITDFSGMSIICPISGVHEAVYQFILWHEKQSK